VRRNGKTNRCLIYLALKLCESKDKPRYIDEFLAERFFVCAETIEFFYIYSVAETFSNLSLNIYSSRCCKIKQGINRMFLISGERGRERKSIILNMANV
jgi:hypothetical protein